MALIQANGRIAFATKQALLLLRWEAQDDDKNIGVLVKNIISLSTLEQQRAVAVSAASSSSMISELPATVAAGGPVFKLASM